MGEPTWQEITAEAIRRKAQALKDGRGDIELEALIVEITREGWKPPEPVVDPDLLAFRKWLAEWNPSVRVTALDGEWDFTSHAQAYLAGARMAREQERERAEALDWLTDKTSLELHWRADPEEDGAWCVHMVVGGVNDREWNLLATGETPLAALKSARTALDKYRGEA